MKFLLILIPFLFIGCTTCDEAALREYVSLRDDVTIEEFEFYFGKPFVKELCKSAMKAQKANK